MLDEKAILLITAETPLHVGGGASLGVIDLPIQRERYTQFPMIQSSGVKGALRDLARRMPSGEGRPDDSCHGISLEDVFGPDTDHADKHAGALILSDARLLLFPVRSMQGVFAWVTCPLVLARFAEDLKRAGVLDFPEVEFHIADEQAIVGTHSTVRVPESSEVVLEEILFSSPSSQDPGANVDKIANYLHQADLFHRTGEQAMYWQQRLWHTPDASTNLVILSDTVFRDFALLSTEVISRIRVNPDTGTVDRGALWSEEQLPSDTVLYTLALADTPRGPTTSKDATAKDVLCYLKTIIEKQPDAMLQLGGNLTVGRGFVRMRVLAKGEGGTP